MILNGFEIHEIEVITNENFKYFEILDLNNNIISIMIINFVFNQLNKEIDHAEIDFH